MLHLLLTLRRLLVIGQSFLIDLVELVESVALLNLLLEWEFTLWMRQGVSIFRDFLGACVRGTHEDYSKSVFWAELTSGGYVPSTTRGNMIRSNTYRLLHRLISDSLMHHKNLEMVPSTDIFFLMDTYYSREEHEPPKCFSFIFATKGLGAS